MNAVFHVTRLVVLSVALYMQWRQWREGRKNEYLLGLIAFLGLVFAELFMAYFYTSGIVTRAPRPGEAHPFWGDYLQSLALLFFAWATPALAGKTNPTSLGKPGRLWPTLALLLLATLPEVWLRFTGWVHFSNAVSSAAAVGFLAWALASVSRLQGGHRHELGTALALLGLSQMFHFGFFIGLRLPWFPIHFGERIFSTLGYVVYLVFLHDHILAEKRRLLEQLQARNAELRRLDALKNQFLSVASHELRTPLTAIHAAASALQRPDLSRNEQQGMVEVIARRSKNLAELVEECLDLSRIQLGKLKYRMEPVSVNALVRNAVAELRPLCRQKDVALHSRVPDRELRVLGDANRLSQVLHNLLANSLKFTPRGGQIAVRCFEREEHVVLCVADSGTGIEPGQMPHIFEAFYHSDSPADCVRGAGLGLWLARSIVEAHGGRIRVRSSPGQGTEFTVSLHKLSVQNTQPTPKEVRLNEHD